MSLYGVASYTTTVTLAGAAAPFSATISAATHGLERVNFVFVMPLGNSPVSISVVVASNGDVTIYGSAAVSVKVIII